MIISVHIPKTAGTSFRQILERNLGGAILFEYHNASCDALLATFRGRPVLTQDEKTRLREYVAQKGVRCLHGHFSSGKYLDVFGDARLITFLRDPIERMLSEYWFHREHDWPGQIAKGVIKPEHYLLGYRIHSGEVTLEEFLLSDEVANIYTRVYGVDRNFGRFDFIGIVEELELSLALLREKVPELANVDAVKINVTRRKEVLAADLDRALLARFKDKNGADYRVYDEATRLLGARAS